MRNKLNLKYPVVVEGKYDKIKLSSVVASPIITLDGFSAVKSEEKRQELHAFASLGGLIILTDSDRAGVFLRGRIKTLLSGKDGITLINAYTPAIKGKDRRKSTPNKDGLLGVESIDSKVLYDILKRFESEGQKTPFLTRQRAYEDMLTGGENSSYLRHEICLSLSLPEGLSAKLLIDYINNFLDEKDYIKLLDEVKIKQKEKEKNNSN